MALTSNTFALIVGVDDYSTFDASMGSGRGTSDLKGARNDARSWLALCDYFLVPPENVRVLTGPVLDESEVAEGVTRGLADAAGIQAGLDWLAEELGADANAAGVVFLGGHAIFERSSSRGRRLQAGFAPTDMTGVVEREGDDAEISYGNLVDLIALKEQFRGVSENLSCFFDFCSSPNLPPALSALQGAIGRRTGQWPGMGSRLVSATEPDQESVELVLDGRWQGAFTWAVRNVLMQWDVRLQDGVVRSTMSYGRLVKAVNAVLNGLGYEQDAVFSGAAKRLAVFQPGLDVELDTLSKTPDAVHGGRQLDGGTAQGFRVLYFLSGPNPQPDQFGNMIGMVVATKVSSPSGNYAGNAEYFRFDSSQVNKLDDGCTMFVADGDWETVDANHPAFDQKLYDLVTWQPPSPSNNNAWSVTRTVFNSSAQSAPSTVPGVYSFSKPGKPVNMRMDFGNGNSNEPLVNWFQDTPAQNLVFFDVVGANFSVHGQGSYNSRFAGGSIVGVASVSQAGGNGWTSYSGGSPVTEQSNVVP